MTANGLRAVWAPLPGVQVVTEITLCAEGHIRRHTTTSTLACETFDVGFALPGTPLALEPMPNTSLQFPKSCIPMIQYAVTPGTTVLETKVTFACNPAAVPCRMCISPTVRSPRSARASASG